MGGIVLGIGPPRDQQAGQILFIQDRGIGGQGQQRMAIRGEDETVATRVVEKGTRPQMVAGQDQSARTMMPSREAPITLKMMDAILTPTAISLDHDLVVGLFWRQTQNGYQRATIIQAGGGDKADQPVFGIALPSERRAWPQNDIGFILLWGRLASGKGGFGLGRHRPTAEIKVAVYAQACSRADVKDR